MATYKVSYKILRQQGEDIKAVAKMVDGYSERVSQISGKLGNDDLLAEVRSNLGKLREQLGESRTVLNTAGEVLVKTVDNYTGVETKQLKKVESTKAHHRDFYKNPVVVASVGGAAAGGAVAAATTPAPTTTVNYTDNSVNVNYTSAVEPVAAAPAVEASPAVVNTAATPAAVPVSETPIPAATISARAAVGGMAGIAAGAGVVGGAVGAGAVIGVKHLMDDEKKTQKAESKPVISNSYDPEEELKKAIQRVKDLDDNA